VTVFFVCLFFIVGSSCLYESVDPFEAVFKFVRMVCVHFTSGLVILSLSPVVYAEWLRGSVTLWTTKGETWSFCLPSLSLGGS
jgi:hypothetical protein